MEISGSLHASAFLPLRKESLVPSKQEDGWMDPRTILDTVERKLSFRCWELNPTTSVIQVMV
jgi:hypothetical protein